MPWTISTRGYTATSLKLGEPTPTDALLPPPCMLVTSGLTTPRFRTFMLTDTKLPHTQCRKYIAWNTSDATTLYTACCWGPIHSLHYTLHLLYINSSLLFFSRSLPWLLYTNFYVFYAAFWSFSFSTRLVWGVTQKPSLTYSTITISPLIFRFPILSLSPLGSGGLTPKETPQIVLLTFDDSVNDLNKELYTELFQNGRKNPNGCPITSTMYVSHEWTDYSQVQNLYADGHEIASHSIQ